MNNFNPSTFYISIIDLFAIFLPGSLVSMTLYHLYKFDFDAMLKIGTDDHNSFHMAFVLLFASYLFGHMVSQLSAYLDEWVYDPLKERVYKDHKRVEKVNDIRKLKYGNTLLDHQYVNTFKWSIYKLQKDYKEGALEVDRYMADSKFFRSLFIIMLLLGIVFLLQAHAQPKLALACFLLAAFSMIRYFKKRRKATETAYGYAIFLEELSTSMKLDLKI